VATLITPEIADWIVDATKEYFHPEQRDREIQEKKDRKQKEKEM